MARFAAVTEGFDARAHRQTAFVAAATGLLCAILPAATDARAQTGGAGPIPLPDQAEGARIATVRVDLRASGGSAARDEAILTRLRASLSALEGTAFNRQSIEARIVAIQQRIGSGRIDYRLATAWPVDGLLLVFELDTREEVSPSRPLTTLYRSERAQVSLIAGGGFGLYSDIHPWFGRPALFNAGSPIAGRLPGRNPAWTEGYVEPGLGAAAQVGDSPFYVYGAATYITSWSYGQDIYRNDPRVFNSLEKAYGGLLYVDPDENRSLNVSAGRQNFTLNDGFLIHFVRGSTNAAERSGLYLGPRNANDFSVVADFQSGAWRLKAFYIDPNELEYLESRTTFAGSNLRYAFTPDFAADVTFVAIPRSSTRFANPFGLALPREGLQALAGHARYRNAARVRGLWLEGELAHQTNENFPMSAWAGYALAGYLASWAPWTPSLSYRYAYFSGDDPLTRRYEKYDPLLSTGLGVWLQGVTFGKLTANTNLETHRLQFNVAPNPALNITFDWHLLRAAQYNNIGANPALSQLASRALGQEFTLTARWALSRNIYLQTVASQAIPGRAFTAIGADKPWTTLQASLYWSL
ncbi:MAG: alginate export family protein [Beijerinckiaceae bacterium]